MVKKRDAVIITITLKVDNPQMAKGHYEMRIIIPTQEPPTKVQTGLD